MKTEKPADPVRLKVNCVIDGRWFGAGERLPFANEAAVPASLKPFIAVDEPDEPQGPPRLNYEAGRVYDIDTTGHILSRHGRRDASALAANAALQAAAEDAAEAAGALDAETAAILQEKHDVDVALQIKTAEIRARDADAVIAAQDEGAGAEQKAADPLYVRRGGAWMHAERARLRPGEPVFVKRPTGAWEAVGAVDASGGLPPPEVIL